jgi:hypothetical protein
VKIAANVNPPESQIQIKFGKPFSFTYGKEIFTNLLPHYPIAALTH